VSVCEQEEVYHDTACDRTIEDHLGMVEQLLPQGRAWPRDPGSNLMRFWTAFADTMKQAEDRICSLTNEFFCDTADETIQSWYDTYDMTLPEEPDPDTDPACLDPAFVIEDKRREELCAVVTRTGGNDCPYFTEVALASNWVIDCTDLAGITPITMAGCMQAGCDQLGITAIPRPAGSSLGLSALGTTDGRAVDYPAKDSFEQQSSNAGAPCGVIPGSPLGCGPISGDCCNIAGYYELPENVGPQSAACSFDDGAIIRPPDW